MLYGLFHYVIPESFDDRQVALKFLVILLWI